MALDTLNCDDSHFGRRNTKERDDCGGTNLGEGGQNERRRYGHSFAIGGPPKRSSLNKGASTKISSSEARVAKQKETSICGNEPTKNVPFRRY